MEPYRQSIASLGLAIERGTPAVPGDGYFYVLFAGQIQGRHRTLKKAQAQYSAIMAGQGWRPDPPPTTADANAEPEAVKRYMDELETYWSDAHGHRRRGGKSMYRS